MFDIDKNAVYILSVDAKDIFLANNLIHKNDIGYGIRYANGDINTKKFINTFDFSLDLIKLREVYEKVYRRNNFSFERNKKEYIHSVINVTFNYSNKTFNKTNENIYIKFGHSQRDVIFNDCVCIKGGELIGVELNKLVEKSIGSDMLGKEFYFEDGVYKVKNNIPVLNTVGSLRHDLYKNGFICDGVKYVRFKRTSGSSRVGKCLFIDEKLYSRMHKWEMCGLKIKEGQETDLAGLESYISLPTSSIIDTMEINADNILVIDDFESIFKDDVIVTTLDDGWLKTYQDNVTVKNSIWDGQSIGDESIFNHSMALLRNRFFKSCCFRGGIQRWFADNGITDISQLNGFTLAKNIKDIKLITTPSSIKYLKFGTIEDWLKNLDPIFGIVKHDKPTHFFDGRMVQTHYQLLNTLQLSYEETKNFIQPSLDYMKLLKTDPAVLRYHIKYPENIEFDITPLNSKNDIVYNMLGINDEFCKTKLYDDFLIDLLKSYRKNLRCGHVLVNGNYSTLFGNPVEMLQHSIGKFDGKSQIGVGNIHSKRFDYNKTILGSRSPHVTMGNVWLTKNTKNDLIDKYFDLSKEIVCVNSIDENLLERLSGADFDSDTVLLTDNEILINAAKRNYDKFKVPTSLVTAKKIKRRYTNAEKADLDIKTSVNKIGEIINLSQELNTIIWDKLNNGESFESILDIYYDASKLDVMSCIEIDKAKKEYAVDNTAELKKIKDKYSITDDKGRTIKPYFFGELAKDKGYYNKNRKNYKQHKTTMDFLQKCINSFRLPTIKKTFIPFTEILDKSKYNTNYVKRDQVERIINIVENTKKEINSIFDNDEITDRGLKLKLSFEKKQECVEYIDKIQISYSTMYCLLSMIEKQENSKICRTLFSILFGTPNKSFFEIIKSSKKDIPVIVENDSGNIDLHGIKYAKIYKK